MFVSSEQTECEGEYSKDDVRVFVERGGGISGRFVGTAGKS